MYVNVANAINASIIQQAGNISGVVYGDVEFEDRNHIVKQFTDPNGPVKVMIFTIKTGAVGYNFQVADKCIFNDFSLNPSENEQGADRIRRLTSTYAGDVYYNVLTSGDQFGLNVDERMHQIMTAKRSANEAVHNSLKQALDIINKEVDSEAKEQHLNALAEQLVKQVLQSMKMDEQARLLYVKPKIKPKTQPQPIAAKTDWYTKLVKVSS